MEVGDEVTRPGTATVVVVGENVVDLLPAGTGTGLLRPTLGGGPANTAIAAARLGVPIAFAGRFSRDTFGQLLRARHVDAGVDVSAAGTVDAPSSLALAALAADGSATYDFWLDGAADFVATPLPVPPDGAILHCGSIAAFWPPGASVLEEWLETYHAGHTVTIDVNLRPVVLARQPDVRHRLERLARLADAVKASDDDLTSAYPHRSAQESARALVADVTGGPRLVVLTEGARGMTAYRRDAAEVHVEAPAVAVVDTIGAGDAAMGALLAWISVDGLERVLDDPVPALRFACATAALACTRAGAYAPTLAEVRAAT